MNASEPLVSIIMNCYNGEKYLDQAINSVLEQTYQNWELIFWDNLSTDRSSEIFLSYKDERLKYFCATEYAVLYEARNLAIEKSRGEFIAFLDVDDYWLSDKLERQIPLFRNENTAVVFGNYSIKNEKDNTSKVVHDRLYTGAILNKLLAEYFVGLVTLVIRKSSVESLSSVFNSNFQIVGDFDLVIRLSAKWDIDAVHDPVAVYRWHGDNLSLKQIDVQVEELEKWIEQMQLDPVIGIQSNFKNQKDLLKYLKGISSLKNGGYYEAFKHFLMLPYGIFKIKLFLSLTIPSFILNKLKTFA